MLIRVDAQGCEILDVLRQSVLITLHYKSVKNELGWLLLQRETGLMYNLKELLSQQ